MKPGQIERRTHDGTRHGTTQAFAALDVAAGQVQARVVARGVLSSTKDLIAKLLALIDHRKQEGKRSRETQSPDAVLASLERPSGHWPDARTASGVSSAYSSWERAW